MSAFRRPSARAFTLIELLVVILIIAILIAVAAPSFLGQQNKAKDSAAKQNVTVAYKAAKAIYTSAGQTGYPAAGVGTSTDTASGASSATVIAQLKDSEPQYTFRNFTSEGASTSSKDVSVELVGTQLVILCTKSDSTAVFCIAADEGSTFASLPAGSFAGDAQAAGVRRYMSPTGNEALVRTQIKATTPAASADVTLAWSGSGTGSTGGGGGGGGSAQTYPQIVAATSGVIGYWPLSDASGTTVAATTGTAGTYTASGVTFGQTSLLAASPALTLTTFNGTSGAARVPFAATGTDKLTIEWWMSIPSVTVGGGTSRILFESGTTYVYAGGKTFIAYLDTSGRPNIVLHDGSYSGLYFPALSTGTHHYMLTMDRAQSTAAAQIKFYIDGVVQTASGTPAGVGSGAMGGNWTSNDGNLYIGSRGNASSWLPGTLQGVALYSSALAPAAALSHCQAGRGTSGATC